MSAILPPGVVAGTAVWAPAPAVQPATLVPPVRRANPWPGRLIRFADGITFAFMLLPSLLLLGLVFIVCTAALVAPFAGLPVIHTTVPWPTMLTEGLTALGVQVPHAVPLAFVALTWLGLSSAGALLAIGARSAR